jgi:eukaryotic-like serine/threonine-protein kinase
VPGSERLSIVAPLPPHGEWRRALALDRGAGPPRRVVLSFAPAAVLDDPERLAALVRDVEAAGRLHHPGALPVLGTETLDDRLAIVEPFRPGATLRALLDAAGRLPADVAARVVVDACAAVARAHALDAGDGRVLVHGGIGPSRVLVGEDGAAVVTGFGAGGGGAPDADVRALAAVLFECLAGEPPGEAASLLQLPGIPAPLAEAVVRALAPGTPAQSPAALAQAIAGAGPLASHADVAAYAEVVRPSREGDEGEADGGPAPQAEEIAADVVVEPTDPVVASPGDPALAGVLAAAAVGGFVEPTFEPLPRPPATRPGADPAGVFAAPAPPAPRSHLPLAVAAVCLLAGLGGGFAAARAGAVPRRLWEAPPPAAPAAGALRVEPAARAADPLPDPATAADDLAPAPSTAPTSPRASAPPRRGKGAPKASAKAVRAAKAAKPAAASAAASPSAKGFLDVTAPAGAEVLLDGRRIGIGGLRVEIPVGRHHVEVRLGEAKVEEAFDLGPGETWTYSVTPTN